MNRAPALLALGAWAIAMGCGPAAVGPAGPRTVTVGPATPASIAAPGPGEPREAPSPDTGRGEKLIARTLRRVSKARGIDATKPVPGVVLSRAALIARVKEHVAKEVPADAIRNEGLVLQLFGFIPTSFDYEKAEFALLEAQLAGYYEPADGTMYLAGDLQDADAEATLAHELVHALQDQKWDLKARSKYRRGQSDLSTAVSALAEGDATSAMFDVMFAQGGRTALDLPDELYAEQIRGSMLSGPTATAPQIMRSSLGAPYIYGTVFVHAMRRRGGWREVNRAWDDPPTTSEQILHVDKYDAHEKPIDVPAPKADSLGAGWKSVDDDAFGELGVRLSFEEWMPPADAADAASGWGGDRGALFKNGELVAFAWRLRYDDGAPQVDALARRSFAMVRAGVAKKLGAAKVTDPTFICFDRGDRGPFAIARFGKEIVFVAGPANASGPTWKSTGSCAVAKTWAAEIVKAR